LPKKHAHFWLNITLWFI